MERSLGWVVRACLRRGEEQKKDLGVRKNHMGSSAKMKENSWTDTECSLEQLQETMGKSLRFHYFVSSTYSSILHLISLWGLNHSVATHCPFSVCMSAVSHYLCLVL